jgi:hypothetical protein
MESDGGHLDYSAILDSEDRVLEGHCRFVDSPPTEPYAADNREPITALRSHYAAEGLPLYVYVAPTALCDGQIDRVRAAYAGVANNMPVALPDRYFANDTVGGHSHVNSDGVVAASNLLANFFSDQKLSFKAGDYAQ